MRHIAIAHQHVTNLPLTNQWISSTRINFLTIISSRECPYLITQWYNNGTSLNTVWYNGHYTQYQYWLTLSVWWSRVHKHSCDLIFHNLIIPLLSLRANNNNNNNNKTTLHTYAEINCIPLLMKIDLSTDVLCPSNVFKQFKSFIDHSLTVQSAELVKTH